MSSATLELQCQGSKAPNNGMHAVAKSLADFSPGHAQRYLKKI